uniref:Exocyst complex component Sec10 n=1 Tax=Heterorhabditis bacteriophora TaxID=37862 RepID=A0A1I7XCS0_HETBA
MNEEVPTSVSFTLHQNNVIIDASRIIKTLLKNNKVDALDWFSCFPNLTLMEILWTILMCRIHADNCQYEEVERLLIDEFGRAQRDEKKMAEVAKILSEFKAYSHCVDRYVEYIQSHFHNRTGSDVLNTFTGKIKDHIYAKLRDCKESDDKEGYLVGLAQSYSNTLRLCKDLEALYVSSDASFLPTLTQSIFSRLQELKRDVQARLMTVETYGGETFLSEDIAISILQETKNAFNRTAQLCEKSEVPKHCENILDVLLKYLYVEHLDYAIELALAGISLAEPKIEPPAYFFSVVAQNTTIVLLLMKQYEDSVYPLVKNTVVEQCVAKKWASALRSLEQKINLGLERQLNSVLGYARYVLGSEQKKADFKPDSQQINLGASSACQQVVRFLTTQASAMERGCDGGNLVVLQSELANRLYKLLLNHIQQFTFNSAGAMLLLCDLNEYRKCVSSWRVGDAARQFESLHALANLLVVLPDNLVDAAHSPMLKKVK